MPENLKKKKGMLEKLVPPLLVISIALAFVVGILWQKVSTLESGAPRVAGVGNPAGPDNGALPPPAGPDQGKLTEEQAANIPTVSAFSERVAGARDPNEEGDHVRGPKDAKVLLIGYSDLECPFCKSFHSTAQQIVDEFEGQVAWVYRHFPLPFLLNPFR